MHNQTHRAPVNHWSVRHYRGLRSFLALCLIFGGCFASSLCGSSDSNYGQIPLVFIANRGQVHNSVRFTAKSPGFTAYFTPEEVVIDVASAVVRMRYPGANVSPTLGGLDLQEGKANYLIGNDPSNWQTDVPLFGRVVYKDLYPGIDMLYSSNTRRLKSEFVVAPGADPSRIQIAYAGVAAIHIDDAGALIFCTPDGELREAAPEIYQEADGRRDPVKGAFRVSGNVVSFLVEEYDHSRELRIDPVLSYSTYLSGSGTNKGTAIAVDSSNAAYITGYTDSTNFPVTSGALQTVSGGSVDVFVTKLNTSGSAIVYSTYIGGSGDDRGFSIAVDGTGDAYVTGWTGSTNFPIVAGAQPSSGGGRDAFVAKLNSTGSALIFSTYLGGTGTDSGNGIAIDSSGVYVTGSTTSANFPVANPVQAALAGGQDAFVTKLSATGSTIVYSTYLGGLLDDRGSSITVDSSGSAYVAGNTNSTNFPVAGNPVQASYGGATDAFVAKLNVTGNPLVYSTYLGGSGQENVEVGRSIAVDSSGSAYVTGMTSSTNFPTFQPVQASLSGSNDAFVVKLNAGGTAFVYSTYLGGSSIDYGESIAIDSSNYAYVGGYTASPDFPSVNADQPVIGGGYDAFVAKLNPAGSALTDTDFLGGSGSDAGYGIALDNSAAAYLTGQTSSSDFPLKTPAQSSLGTTNLAAFAAKFTFGSNGTLAPISVSPASGSGTSQTFTAVYSDPSGYADINWVNVLFQTQITGQSACLVQYVRATNIIALVNDSGSGSVSATPGTIGTLNNSQCTVDTGASSVSGSGSTLTLTIALIFKPVFAGPQNIYMDVFNNALATSGWQAKGAWTVAGSLPPTNVSVSPASGTRTTQVFTFVYSDPSGFADINWVNMLFQTQITGQNACLVQYVLASNTIDLVADSGSGYAGTATVGTFGTLSNSQCSVDTGASSVSGSGNNLSVTVALTFKPQFAGAKNIYMSVYNKALVSIGWLTKGAWTVPGSLPPANVSVSPTSGMGITQVFTFVYSDASGYADINWVNMLFQTQLAGQSACLVQYTPANNALYLVNDSGSWYAGTATPGTAGTLNNTQCTVDTGASSALSSGNTLTVTVALTFKTTFTGTKNIYMSVFNNSTVTSGWQAEGTWNATNLPPSNVSVTPASGTGTTQVFTFIYSDPNGYTDIHYVNMLFQTQLSGQNACVVQYMPATNVLDLVADSGSGYAGTAILGTAGTLNNSQCSVDTGASSASGSGNNLTVSAAVTFKPAFAGLKNIYMSVFNKADVGSAWQVEGTWTAR
jgi:hypothetical protein